MLLLAMGAVGWVISWIQHLSAQDWFGVEVVVSVTVLGALIAIAVKLLRYLKNRKRYHQMLLDFRWHPGMTPVEFERCCADYLSLKGWSAKTTKGSGDQGVDVIARKAGHTIVLQCKLYSKPIGNKAVQEAFAAKAYANADTAAVISNQSYTAAAQALAGKTGVLLLHFTDLQDLGRRLGDTAL
ncbi:putative endonuclease [Acidocella aminolytica 101 = DSM 11237]|nr:restriction endonuclease [Acidocella aminolytica]GBQ38431.1 putative endonuclease [Acidocella aminolytica 101 = DSM 11237]